MTDKRLGKPKRPSGSYNETAVAPLAKLFQKPCCPKTFTFMLYVEIGEFFSCLLNSLCLEQGVVLEMSIPVDS